MEMEMEMEINKSGLFNTIKKWFECTEFEVGFQKKERNGNVNWILKWN